MKSIALALVALMAAVSCGSASALAVVREGRS